MVTHWLDRLARASASNERLSRRQLARSAAAVDPGGGRLDAVARAVAAPMSRRRMLGVSGATLVSLAAAALRPGSAAGTHCPPDRVHCTGRFDEICCVEGTCRQLPDGFPTCCAPGTYSCDCPPGTPFCGGGRDPCCPDGTKCCRSSQDTALCCPPDNQCCGLPGGFARECCPPGENCASAFCRAGGDIARCCPEGQPAFRAADGSIQCCPPDRTFCSSCNSDGIGACCGPGQECGFRCGPDSICESKCLCSDTREFACGGECCPPGVPCVEDKCQCPDGRAICGGVCCAAGEVCSNEPGGPVCRADCPAGQLRCGDACCAEDEVCVVEGGEVVCRDRCPEGQDVCEGNCCRPGEECTTSSAGVKTCCPAGQVACTDTSGGITLTTCCAPGEVCDGSGGCCAELCGESCCRPGEECTTSSAGVKTCCPAGQVACTDTSGGITLTTCCAPGEVCDGSGGCCLPEALCPDGCCRPGEDCKTSQEGVSVCCPASQVACTNISDGITLTTCCAPGEVCDGSGGCCLPEALCPDGCCSPGEVCKTSQEGVSVCCPAGRVACTDESSPGAVVTQCCAPGEECRNGRCKKSKDCDGVTCPPGEVCKNGKCKKAK